jgi:sugar lactone lactonase YvrE
MVLMQGLPGAAAETIVERERKASEINKKSIELYKQKNYKGFVEKTRKALAIFPESFRLRYQLARGLALTGQKEEALKILKHLVHLGLIPEEENQEDFKGLKTDKAFQDLWVKIRALKKPLVNSQPAFIVPERDLIPESIAYDPVDKAFYMGSLGKCKIIRIDSRKKITDFAGPRQDGLLPVLGMRVDPERRVLWACTGFGYPHDGVEKELFGTTGIFKYDLKSGKLLKKYMLPKEENRFFNDVALAPDGTVFMSDSHLPAVYTIDAKKEVLEKLTDLPDSLYPNGITYSPDSGKIFVSAYNRIAVVNRKTGKVSKLAHPDDYFISACDGLYYYKNSLVGIQNTIGKGRIVRLMLDKKQEKVIHMKILERENPLFMIPTTGAIADDHLYFMANVLLRAFDSQGKLPPPDQLQDVKVLKLKLKE